MSVIALVNVVTVPAQHGRDWHEAQARKEREYQACSRPWEAAFQQTIKDIQRGVDLAERKAEDAYRIAARNAKTEAERAAAKKAKLEAVRKAKLDSRGAMRDAQEIRQKALQSCRNPKQLEQTNNNSNKSNKPAESSARSCGGNNSAGGTLGHGPRPRNPSVRMDLLVVDESGKPVRGVKTKLWSERQSNGLSCETIHTTGACGNVLMDPIHITKTLQLKLEAKGFEPQLIRVEPSQLDRPFRAVMQAKRSH
ncbi:MAG TPA: hypothetical protein VGX24_11610 [Pyrinomonadaceae bacterium]|jgi:hypothetical protein|nr:hypothetical protein [Pyrinomonadaceae bacterium]